MTREPHTAEEIRDEVARILNAGRKVPITVPLPMKLMEPDWTVDPEANWAIPHHASFQADTAAVRDAILAVKARWNLKP